MIDFAEELTALIEAFVSDLLDLILAFLNALFGGILSLG